MISGGYGATTSVMSQYGTSGSSFSISPSAAGAISGVAGAVSSIFAGQAQAIGYEMQAAARKAQAAQAISQAKMTTLRLTQSYNAKAANNAVMAVAQGRSGGTVANISRVDQEKLQWDIDYTKYGGQAGQAGMMADAIGFSSAASNVSTGGIQKGLMQVAQTAIDYQRIK